MTRRQKDPRSWRRRGLTIGVVVAITVIVPLSAALAATGTLSISGGSASYNVVFDDPSFTTGRARLAVRLRDTSADGRCVTGKVTYHLNARPDRAVNLQTVCGYGKSFTSYPSYTACCYPVYLEGVSIEVCRVRNNWFDACRSVPIDNPQR